MESKNNIQKDPIKAHQQQTFWFIYLPLILIVLIVVAIGLFFILNSTSGGSLTTWSSIAVILLITPFVFIGTITLVILILSVIGMVKANKAVPPRLRSFRTILLHLNTKAREYANRSASPIINGRSIISGFNAFLNLALFHNKNRRNR